MKCDEQLPVCQNCIKSSRKCYRGVRLNFIQYSFYDPNDDVQLGKSFRILDQSVTIAKLYDGKRHYRPYLGLHSKEDLKESDEIFKMECENGTGISLLDGEFSGEFISGNRSLPNGSVPNGGRSKSAGDTRAALVSNSPQIEGVKLDDDLGVLDEKVNKGPLNKYRLSSRPHSRLSNEDMSGGFTAPRPQTSIDSPFFSEDLMSTLEMPNMSSTFSIQNFLVKPQHEVELPNLSSSKIIFDNPNFEFDVHKFIRLMDFERYYWLLDLFNELNIWKSLVPSYCVSLVNNHMENTQVVGNTFLMECLLNCSLENVGQWDHSGNIYRTQLKLFHFSRKLPVSMDNVKLFEILFISIVLILLKLLNRIVFQNDLNDIHVVFNNQARIFNKSVYKLFHTSSTKQRKLRSAVLVSCLQSTSILKFLINKNIESHQYSNNDTPNDDVLESKEDNNRDNDTNESFDLDGDANGALQAAQGLKKEPGLSPTGLEYSSPSSIDSAAWEEDMEEDIEYNHEEYATIKKLNYFEVQNLFSDFFDFDFPQIDDQFTSNASKLRRIFWYLMRLDYSSKFPAFKTFDIKNNFEIPQYPAFHSNIIFPNDQLTLIVLLSKYLLLALEQGDTNPLKLQAQENGDTNLTASLNSTFEVINNSMITDSQKRVWIGHFGWMLK
ncbi:hypothetical protein PSN45_003286 [Yamadazyma tenuis]|nr:hypothetical protein PSN45_003286 [Yamadazyma tenuis]